MLIPDKFNSNYNIRIIKLNYKDLNIDLLNIIEQKYKILYWSTKNKNI